MSDNVLILMVEAVSVYLLVLAAHSLRFKAGLAPFYALLGSITAIMSWVTDAGVQVQAFGITFMVGSTVFYTALLLGVFVVYVFDGPQSTRLAILTIAGVSIMMPVVAIILHAQVALSGHPDLGYIPIPSLRINGASVLTTIADLIFLAMAWEFLGKPELRVRIWLRAFATLLGVMVLDVVLFNTGAFAGTPQYVEIMTGTLVSRVIVAAFAFPFLYAYLNLQNQRMGTVIEYRPVLAILREVAEVRAELDVARREIERRRQAEAALQDSEEHYRSVMDTASDMIILTDLEGRIIYANRAGLEAGGYSREEALKLTLFDIVPSDLAGAARERLAQRQERREDVFLYESAFVNRAGERMPVEVSSSLVLRDNEPAEVLIMARDIRERQRMQAEQHLLRTQLMEAQRMEAVGQLAGGIAHDFNNLLTAVNGYAELIQYKVQDDGIRDMASKIQAAGERAAVLVGQLLTFARKQRIQPEIIDLNVVVGLVLQGKPKGVDLTADLQPGLNALYLDPAQAEQLVDNLLGHVCDAAPEADRISIRTSNTTISAADAGKPANLPPGDYVLLEIIQPGPSLDIGVLRRVFEPFFFASDAVADGIGLRLATVYGIVKQNDGVIVVDSLTGDGTRYRVFLPVARRP